MKIVSLLPSATEILFAVGAGDQVVGVTFECDFPIAARSRRIVSTTTLPVGLTPAEIDATVRGRLKAKDQLYRLDADALADLSPDLIVTQDLCAVCAIEVDDVSGALAHLGCDAAVLTVDPRTLAEVIESIATVADAAGRAIDGREVTASLQARLDVVARVVAGRERPRVTVVEWTDPPFTAGHWIPDMVTAAGGFATGGDAGGRSTTTTWAAIAASRPDVVVIAPCGYRLPDATAMAEQLCDDGRLPAGVPVVAVDADAAFVRPGPRLVDGVEALAAILHPDAPGLEARRDIAAQVRSGSTK